MSKVCVIDATSGVGINENVAVRLLTKLLSSQNEVLTERTHRVLMYLYPKTYSVIVIGSGHAGVEAALAAARMGHSTLMLTINLDTIGQMSCNPSIGGLAKGHLVREIDALGGEMGKTADMTGLQFRMLNTKKGPSVWSPRAQCDKKAYQFRLKHVCERQANLDIKQSQVVRILVEDGAVAGVETSIGTVFRGGSIVVTTGTFLMGLMHIGGSKQSGGRAGEASATDLSSSLQKLGLELGRLKTGTPPRLVRSSIDFSNMEAQNGDEPVPYFSYWKEELFHMEHFGANRNVLSSATYPQGSILNAIGNQLPCYLTHTTRKTGEIVRANLHKSPMYSGAIEGIGPRYCPSIEDKIVRFTDKERHQIFLEPEGIATDEFYINGLSTSLPFDVQVDLVHSVLGCESAEILRPAYAVEYDFVNPTQLLPTLETKSCRNLFLGGQINGTSGYEEAGAQGLIAGINAALRIRGEDPIILRRDQAYIGVMIDDLVTRGTIEPYRMFTSRAEYRLTLRQDNADMRLSEIGFKIGLLSRRNHDRFRAKKAAVEREILRLNQIRVGGTIASKLLRRPEIKYLDLEVRDVSLPSEVTEQVEIELKYAGYIDRQEIDIKTFTSIQNRMIPEQIDYHSIIGLGTEAREKLTKIRPATFGQASRIPGISASDLSLVAVWAKRGPNQKAKTQIL